MRRTATPEKPAPVLPGRDIMHGYAIVLLVAAQRLGEVVLSRQWLRPERETGRAEPDSDPLYIPMVAVHTAWLAGMALELYGRTPAFSPAIALPAGAVWVLALALKGWVLATLGRLWNVRIVRRTAQPVVTAGPYRFVRHPNYLAVILEMAAVPLLVGAYWTALAGSLANAAVLWGRIRREERHLSTLPAYRAAFGRKKRLVPGLF